MRKHWKLMLLALTAALCLTMVLGATAFASTSDDDGDTQQTFIAKLAEKLGITEDEMDKAIVETRNEMEAEALAERLAEAVEEGLITEDDATDIETWWDSRPEVLDDPEVRQALRPDRCPCRCGMGGMGMGTSEQSLESLDALVEEGILTQEQADEILDEVNDSRPMFIAARGSFNTARSTGR